MFINRLTMTYEELEKKTKSLEKEQEKVYAKYSKQIHKLNTDYISEHKPICLKRFQRIMVRLRITEESRKYMDDKHRAMAKNQLGKEYSLSGVFNGWCIGKKGDIRPCFYGEPSYSAYDEVLSVELAKEQPEGHCSKCRCHKDGLCFMMGGKDISNRLAVWKITDDMVTCPKYEEIVDGGLYEYGDASRYCPNITKVLKKGEVFYRVYSLNWNYYTEYSEKEIWHYYTKEPKK